MKKIFPLLLLLWVSFTPSCFKVDMKPDEPKMPPLTTEGRNTFGCYINGEPWVAEVPFGAGFSGIRKIEARLNPLTGYFGISAKKTNSNRSIDQNMVVAIANIEGENVYQSYPIKLNWDENYNCDYIFFQLDTNFIHDIDIVKFDTISKIASGTFAYTLINQECNDTLKVTDGRFDVRFAIVE